MDTITDDLQTLHLDEKSDDASTAAQGSKSRSRRHRKRLTKPTSSVEIQCNLGNDLILEAEEKIAQLRQERDKLCVTALDATLKLNELRQHFHREMHGDSFDEIHEEVNTMSRLKELNQYEQEPAPSEDYVSSDDEFPDGCHVKLGISNAPANWTTDEFRTLVAMHVASASHFKLRSNAGHCSCFVKSIEDALMMYDKLHLASGRVIKIRRVQYTESIMQSSRDNRNSYDGADDEQNPELSGESEDAEPLPTLDLGDVVELHGLTSDQGSQLNGLIGVITKLFSTDRVGVETAPGKSTSFRRENLRLVGKAI
jgi:hypothetical protein